MNKEKQLLYALIKRSPYAQASSAFKNDLYNSLQKEINKSNNTLPFYTMKKLFIVLGSIAIPVVLIGVGFLLTRHTAVPQATTTQGATQQASTTTVTQQTPASNNNAQLIAGKLAAIQQQLSDGTNAESNDYTSMNATINTANQDSTDSTLSAQQ